MKKKFLVVIPARRGSKGIPNKNFLDLNGKSVIEYTIDHAKSLSEYCEILISTDNFEYLQSLIKATNSGIESIVSNGKCKIDAVGGMMLHYRAEHLSNDDTSIMKVLSNILSELESVGNEFMGVVLLQPTVPFRANSDREKLLNYLKMEATIDSSFVTFKRVGDGHPARMYQASGSIFRSLGFFPDHQYSRRQDLPTLLLRDGCYYFIGRELIERGVQVGEEPKGFIRDFPWTINLDEESDLIVAQASVATIANLIGRGA